MGFQVSPGVNVTEIDLTTLVPAVSTTEAAIGGVFQWGPVEDRDLISSQNELVIRYGKPTSDNLITSTGTGDSIFALPEPRVPTKITSCKSALEAFKLIFNSEFKTVCLLDSNPI